MNTSLFRLAILLFIATAFPSCEVFILLHDASVDAKNKRKALEEAKPFNVEEFKVSFQEFKDYSRDGKIGPREVGYIAIQYQNTSERWLPANNRALNVKIISSDTSLLKVSGYREMNYYERRQPGLTSAYQVELIGGSNITEEKNVSIKVIVRVDGQTKVHEVAEIAVTPKQSNDLDFVSSSGTSVKSLAGKYFISSYDAKGARLHLKDDGTFDYLNPSGKAITKGKWRIKGMASTYSGDVSLYDGIEFYDFNRLLRSNFFFHKPSPQVVYVQKAAYNSLHLGGKCIFKFEEEVYDNQLEVLNKLIVGGWKCDFSTTEAYSPFFKFRFHPDHRYEYNVNATYEEGSGTGQWEFFPTVKEDGQVYYSLVLYDKEPERSSDRYQVKAIDGETNQITISPDISSCLRNELSKEFVMKKDDSIQIDLSKKLKRKGDTPSLFGPSSSTCSYCGGAGYTREWGPCRSCHGSGKSRH